MSLIDHSDWLEGAEGSRQSGANTRAPQGEMEGGRRPPSFEYLKRMLGGLNEQVFLMLMSKCERRVVAVLLKCD